MIEYGIFNDEGCIESGLWSKEQAEAALDTWVQEGEGGTTFRSASFAPSTTSSRRRAARSATPRKTRRTEASLVFACSARIR